VKADLTQFPRRNMTTKERVLLTGISGALGQIIARDLNKQFHVVGVDRRPFPKKPKDVELHSLDLRRKSAFTFFKDKQLSAIVHVGVIRNPQKHRGNSSAYYYNVEIATQLLKLAEQLGIRKLVFLSTANLYGPSAHTSGFLSEDAPLHGANRSPEVRDLVAIDMMIQSFFWKQPNIETVILRPVHIVGPTLNNAPSRYARLRRQPIMLGYDPMVQVVHPKDVAQSIRLSLAEKIRGVFNIVGHGEAPLSRIAKALNVSTIPIPEFLFRRAMSSAFRYGLSSYPPGELDHLKYACLVDGSRAQREMSYRPQHALMDIIQEIKSS
jgi:UDP-glucose 4-epimerase